MIISGFLKNSFIDYPGKIAAVIFTGGCNLDCWYCHNRQLIAGAADAYKFDEILSFLTERKDFLDAVVFSGGEPTLQPDIIEKIQAVKKSGFLVKLDTNGTRPDVIGRLLSLRLLDYIAMDVKAPLDKYGALSAQQTGAEGSGLQRELLKTGKTVNASRFRLLKDTLKESIGLIKNSGAEYEFRTTCIPDLSVKDIEEIAQDIEGARLYSLQQYRHDEKYREFKTGDLTPHDSGFFQKAKAAAERFVTKVIVKN